MTDLDEALGYAVPDELTEPCEAPPDADAADRMLYSLGRLAERLREIEKLAQARIETIALWQQEESRKIKDRYDWLEQGVTGWARAVHEKDPSSKTIRLPNGQVAIRLRQPRVETYAPMLDLDLLRQTRPGWVREKLEPEKNAIKAAVVPSKMAVDVGPEAPEGYAVHHALDKATGEIVPGVYIYVPVDKSVSVTPA